MRQLALAILLAALPAAAVEPGFVSLFDGRTLNGWVVTGNPAGWEVRDGVLRSDNGKGGGFLRTAEQHANYELRLDYQHSKVGNSGLQIRDAFEVQILAPWTPHRDDIHCTASLYGHVAPQHRPNEDGLKWRSMRILCRWRRIEIDVDGERCTTADLDQVPTLKDAPLKGWIMLQDSHSGDGEWIEFRNLRLRDLDADPAVVTEGLTSDDPAMRAVAEWAAAKAGPAVLPAALELLAAADEARRRCGQGAAYRAVAAAEPKERDAVERVLLARLKGELAPAARQVVVGLLGLTGGKAAARALGEALADPALAPDAAAALGRIPGKDATAALLRGLTLADATARPAVAALLGERQAREAVGPLRELAAKGAPADRAAALRALAAFADRKLLASLQAGAADPDGEVQRAARLGLLRLADALRERDAKTAAGIYKQVWEQGGRGERSAALVGLATASPAEAVPLLLAALADPQLRATACGVLLSLDGPETKAAVETALAHPTTDDQLLCFRWLVRHDPAGAPVYLLPAARGAPGAAVRVAALDLLPGEPRHETIFLAAMGAEDGSVREAGARGLVRLAEAHLGAGRKTRALALFHRVLGANVGGRPIRQALEGVTALADAGSIEPVKALLARGVARGQVAEALYAIAVKLLPGEKPVAMALLEQVARLQPPVGVRTAALVQLKGLGVDIDLAREDGFVTRWWLLGALPATGDAVYGKTLFPDGKPDPSKPVDFDGKHYVWGKHHETKSAQGVVELLDFYPNATNVAAYALAEVTSEQERAVVFRVGSDDGYELWVNGERLGGFAGGRMLQVDNEALPGKLLKGRNTLLVKILNGGSRWAFVVRIVDAEGRPVAFEQQEE